MKFSEVWVRILIKYIVSIFNDSLIDGVYGMRSRKNKLGVVSG